MLLLEANHTWAAIRDKLDCNDAFISRWSKRFREERLAGLFSRHAGQEATTLTPALEARILQWTLKRTPPDGTTQWSTRRLGTQLKVSHMMVARVWAKHGLKPQRLDRYMATNDPDFEQKAADIIGLYLNPPAHAAVFCVDEKTAIQALDRKDPVLPLSPDAHISYLVLISFLMKAISSALYGVPSFRKISWNHTAGSRSV